jgi:transcriptional regulator with XRE-family HTH domain
MRRAKPSPTPPPSHADEPPHRRTFPGLSSALDRLQQVAGYLPEFDEVRERLDELSAFAPLVRLTPRQTLALSAEAVRLLGEQTRALRDLLGLTREQVAQRCGLAYSTIRNFETGRHRLSDAGIAWLLGALLPLAHGNDNLNPDLIAALRGVYSLAAGLSKQPTIEEVLPPMTPDEPEKETPKNPESEAWGRTVQRRREAAHLPQHQLAIRAGLSVSELKGIESGHVEPTEKQRRRILEVLRDAEKMPKR